MRNLLRHELKLVVHPTNWIFLALSAMLLIPNYPYYVVFFYGCLGFLFTFTDARENQDLLFPVSYTHLRAHETEHHLVCRSVVV